MLKWKKILIMIGACIVPIFLTLIISVVSALMAAVAGAGNQTDYTGGGQSGSLSQAVMAYQPVVKKYCDKYGIPDYAMLVLAVMQQESGGGGNDPMQCSECGLNLKYPHSPNSITDPDYSIEVGVEYLASCLRAAHCTSPSDTKGISLALQGYNFGNGYIAWALARGGYSPASAVEFSNMEMAATGYKRYGDVDYVQHVLRYYISSGTFLAPLRVGTYTISRGWGLDGSEFHKGIDFAAPAGTPIYAVAAGTVKFSGFGKSGSGFGGYGNIIMIQHENNFGSLYGHCSKLLVQTGETVQKGQVIALVGSTGDSTGNHCHFEIRINNIQVNPAPYLNL